MKMVPVFVWSRRKDKNIVDVGHTEREVTEDIIHHALKVAQALLWPKQE